MKKTILGICLIILAYSPGLLYAQFAQDTMQELSPGKTKRLAKKLTKRGSYYNAVTYWEQYHGKKPDKLKAIDEIARLNYLLRDYKMAEKWYKTLLDADSTGEFPKTRYWYAVMLKHNGKYDEAKEQFTIFIDRYLADDSKEYHELAQKHISGCELAKNQMENPVRVEITHLDEHINNPFTDYAPQQAGDALYFSSIRSDSVLDVLKLKGIDYYSKIYRSSRNGDSWSPAVVLEGPVNSSTAHTGNGAFSPDGTRFYFTRCTTKKRNLISRCDIYMSKKSGDKWSEPEKLGPEINMKKYTNTQPSIGLAEGKEVLYFVSNREGGVGGMDIWYAESTGNGMFGTPVNAGAVINTSGDETTPFYDNQNKKLYFSSNGHVNIGGSDIFYSSGNRGQWDEPVNIGFPLNSSADDLYFVIDKEEKEGFFASNRPSHFSLKSETCCDDIYQYRMIKEIYLDGYVAKKSDPETPIGDADVSVFTVTGDNLALISTFKTDTAEHFVLPLDPEKVYQVNATKPGFWGSEEIIDLSKIVVKDTLFKVFLIEEIVRRKIKLKRIYYEFDKYDITSQYKVTLDSLYDVLQANEKFTLEIIGHCDSVGSEKYNQELGRRRAQSAADYLMKKGIAPERLTLISKGESEPLMPNSKPNGQDDPVGRAHNRRVEFKVNTNDPNLEIEIEYVNVKRTDTR
ncbi:MAG: cell envelope biogenesis protein OmpA [Chitinophagales bacterium]|nr:MAG: cell envelope biogenesis protein OmpA [Chitinophagales bacterium]